MVVRANKADDGIGGHISTFASAATLYEVAFNHFFRGSDGDRDGDVVFFQGHASPGIYARAYLEGRIDETHLENFRRELRPHGGLSSYPHPWLMPDFWEYPTVSMGLGPIMAIYHARFIRYMEDRGLKPKSDAKVWAFLGDGETDEPETLGAITLPAREKLDNLIFVINCNLQRLDGPVRGQRTDHSGARSDVPRRGLERRQGALGPRVGRAAREGSRRPARQADGRNRRRPVSEIQRRVRCLRPPALLGHRSAASGDGQASHRRPAEEADARRPRFGQGLQRLQGGDRAQGRADRRPGAHHQGLRSRRSGRGQEHHPPAEEDERRRAARVPLALRHPDLRRRNSPHAVLPAARRLDRDSLHARAASGARRISAEPQGALAAARRRAARAVRGIPQGHRRPQGVDDDGVRAAAVEAAARQGSRSPRGADRARRSAHLRHGSAVPPGRHLFTRRAGLRTGRHGHAPLLQGSVRRPDSRGRDHRSGIDVVVHRRPAPPTRRTA